MLRSKQNASLLPPLRSCLSFQLRDDPTTGLDQQTLQPPEGCSQSVNQPTRTDPKN